MIRKKILQVGALSLLLSSPYAFSANDHIDDEFYVKNIENKISDNFGSDNVVEQRVKYGGDLASVFFYFRKSLLNSFYINDPDYFYMWHGKDQSAYPFMNLSSMMVNNKTLKRPNAVFMGVDSENGWEDGDKKSELIESSSLLYKKKSGFRREISVGYDLGAAQAYRFACTKSKGYALLSSGGLFKDESCRAKNMGVIYSINTLETVFPIDASHGFTGMEPYSLKDRLDGNRTIRKLKSLLSCSSKVVVKTLVGEKVTYSCRNNNQLIVIKNDIPFHQWNGYSNVKKDTYNMYGEPVKPPLTHWLYTEFGVK